MSNLIQKYLHYLRDNPQGYWFKAKLHGWGWMPATWQGWLVFIVYIAFILILVSLREKSIAGNPDSGSNFLVFGLPILLLTIPLIVICYRKGEKL